MVKEHIGKEMYNSGEFAPLPTISDNDVERFSIGVGELDRVLGGGVVPRSAILVGGEPGIGKSTLLLQMSEKISNLGMNTLYVSGEESAHQIKLRANRLGISEDNILIAMSTELRAITAMISAQKTTPGLVIIDSIQTVYHGEISSAPGTVLQIRSCALELINMAKSRGFALVLVGHVTKDGQIAGPKVLEHMVDVVLYFESEKEQRYRIIRGVKNRYGPANEIGIFEMRDRGLMEVNNPATIFLPESVEKTNGSCIFGGLQGSRLMFTEIQALITPTFLASPRRAVVGWDHNRLAMMIAILNSRVKLNLLDKEIYLNVVGGLRISDPGADLAVVAALISAAKNIIIPRQCIFIGEVGLSGEVRQVHDLPGRIKEAEKLGFKQAIVPLFGSKKERPKLSSISLMEITTVADLEEKMEAVSVSGAK